MSKKKLDNLGVSAFCESMAMMLRSGIQTDEAIHLLQSGSDNKGGVLEQGLTDMRRQIEEGTSLAAAMKDSGIFPKYAIQMISAGEKSGHLEDILFRLSTYYAQQHTIAEKLRSAVTYPAVMLILIIAVLAVMLILVLPAFTDVYNNLTGSLTSSIYGYVTWAYVFCWVALGVMVLLAAALIVGVLMWNSSKRHLVETVLWKIPICASILETMGMFRFTAALSTFLASGEMQDEAVLSSIPMTDCKPVEEKLKKMALGMEEGHGIAQAAYDVGLFEPVYGRMLLAGERSGNLEDVLETLTEHLEESCSAKVDRLVGTVDPLLSGVLVLTVGLALISVMLPLIGMMNSVG